ncbi:DUF4381 family protein [Thiothrix subterranea]|uniref:DUF4381 family protein n=1 Tax=Thiothrix subterranea TaxID=2735563 RepID=UPI00192B5278|nr:DUF4381 family protein [Thiothrix subterranea]QQZ29958.1 DUF4381 family protein [Thiothrix subterranea]
MNSPVLHDLELPPVPLPDDVWWLLALVVLLLLLAGLVWWRKWQHPVARALRQLERLPNSPPNPAKLASILREAGLTSPAALDHTRFAPTPCTPETFATLKREARTLLEQAR